MIKIEQKNIFVFVVCGGIEHIDTLHYSLEALKKFSKNEVYILTDSKRNEKQIIHDKIFDIATPSDFNHHQASIFLKTGVRRFLPPGNKYCYLDTDVVALDKFVDEIFNEYKSPITFAPDHCVADQFSPSAMHCGCAEKFNEWESELKNLFIKYKDLSREPENLEKKEKLLKNLDKIKQNKLLYKWVSIKFNLSRNIFKLDEDNFLDKRKNLWVDKNGQAVLYEKDIKSTVDLIESTTPYRQDKTDKNLWTREGEDVFDARCTHLHQAIEKEFGIPIGQKDWQHWNGGVFLFDDESKDFLEAWHTKTLRIFGLKDWKTRDQGTLIATAWEFGLQKHHILPKKFNLIADYGHKKIKHLGNLKFEIISNQQEQIQAHFIHVYHHWADLKWEVWNEVELKIGIKTDPDAATLNALWIGEHLSKLELLTIHSYLNLGYKFKLWTYNDLKTEVPKGTTLANAAEIIPKEKVFSYKYSNKYGHGKGSYAGFSDIFRYKLLFEKGGWWTDMDVCCLKPIDFDTSYFFRNHHELMVVGNLMKVPKNSELMKLCYQEASETVTADNTDWHKPINILNNNIKKLGLEKHVKSNLSNHDKWEITSKYIWNSDNFPKEWHFIHWQNEEWRHKNVNKNHFYHKSALAKQMAKFGLFEPPKNKWEEIKNEFCFSKFLRKTKTIF